MTGGWFCLARCISRRSVLAAYRKAGGWFFLPAAVAMYFTAMLPRGPTSTHRPSHPLSIPPSRPHLLPLFLPEKPQPTGSGAGSIQVTYAIRDSESESRRFSPAAVGKSSYLSRPRREQGNAESVPGRLARHVTFPAACREIHRRGGRQAESPSSCLTVHSERGGNGVYLTGLSRPDPSHGCSVFTISQIGLR